MKKIDCPNNDWKQRIHSVTSKSFYNSRLDSTGLWIENTLNKPAFEFKIISADNFADGKSIIDIAAHEIHFTSYVDYNQCLSVIKDFVNDDAPKKYYHLKRGITFCPSNKLSDLFVNGVAPLFFGCDPGGQIIVIKNSHEYFERGGFARLLYTLSQYPNDMSSSFPKGFAVLSAWNRLEPQVYLSVILKLISFSFFPYILGITASHGVNITFLFIPSIPLKSVDDPTSPTWRDFFEEGLDFADERREIGDYTPHDRTKHGKYYFDKPPSQVDITKYFEWAIGAANELVVKLNDLTNFADYSNTIDPVYALEYSHSIMHMLKDAAHIIASDSSYQNKSITFRVADLLSRLASIGSLHVQEADYFKGLFRCDIAKPRIKHILNGTDIRALQNLSDISDMLYDELKKSIIDSIWIQSKIQPSGVLVKSRDLTSERIETADEFTGNVIRSLRNTHHGYFTRGDINSSRPSRYLSLVDGSTRDDMPTLTVLWILALLSSAETLIGHPL